jgi:hypothetical protein
MQDRLSGTPSGSTNWMRLSARWANSSPSRFAKRPEKTNLITPAEPFKTVRRPLETLFLDVGSWSVPKGRKGSRERNRRLRSLELQAEGDQPGQGVNRPAPSGTTQNRHSLVRQAPPDRGIGRFRGPVRRPGVCARIDGGRGGAGDSQDERTPTGDPGESGLRFEAFG